MAFERSGVSDKLRDPEVCDLPTFLVPQDGARLEVAMKDVLNLYPLQLALRACLYERCSEPGVVTPSL